MENAINKIEMVVTNLLNFSRKPSFDYSEISLNQIIQNALLLVGHRLEKLRITVANNLDSNLPAIKGNKNELEQVFVNLFINAIDAIEEKCAVYKDSERRIEINSFVKKDEVEIEIRDTGKGIPKQMLDKIFDPFFTTKEVGKGTGLGLSIVYNIVTAHNGTIKFESEEGKGTKVILHLKT
jgi:signal transduction histidine kinase